MTLGRQRRIGRRARRNGRALVGRQGWLSRRRHCHRGRAIAVLARRFRWRQSVSRWNVAGQIRLAARAVGLWPISIGLPILFRASIAKATRAVAII